MALPTSSSSTEPAIEVAGLAKRFGNGVVALAGVDLIIEAGSFVVVLGPSGAGKSTLLRCINGLETPRAGGAVVEGRAVDRHSLRAIRTRVANLIRRWIMTPCGRARPC